MTVGVILGIALLAAAQQSTVVQQTTTGWCSPAVANVTGSVSITCIGVDPRALVRLNKELDRKNLQIAQKIKEANDWADKYFVLISRLSATSDQPELSQQAQDYIQEGELEKAGTILDQLLDTEDKKVDRYAADHFNRALIFLLQFQPSNAIPLIAKAHQYSPENIEYSQVYAALLIQQRDFQKAETILSDVLDRSKRRAKDDPGYEKQVASDLFNISIIYFQTDRLNAAEENLRQALTIDRRIVKINPSHAGKLASTLGFLAEIHSDQGKPKDAEREFLEALDIDRNLMSSNASLYVIDLCDILKNLGNFYFETGRPDAAERVYREAVSILRKQSESSPLLRVSLAESLTDMANFYDRNLLYEETLPILSMFDVRLSRGRGKFPVYLQIDQQRQEEIEADLREALEIYRALAKDDPAAYVSNLADTQGYLVDFYTHSGRLRDAEIIGKEAVDLYQTLANENATFYSHDLAEAWDRLAKVDSQIADKAAEAETDWEHSLEVRRKLAHEDPSTFSIELDDHLIGAEMYLTDEKKMAVEKNSVYRELYNEYRTLAVKDPSKYLSRVLTTLSNLDRSQSGDGTDEFVETGYHDLMQTYKQLVVKEPATNLPRMVDILHGYALSRLYRANYDIEEILDELDHIIDIYRSLVNVEPEVYLPGLKGALSEAYQLFKDRRPEKLDGIEGSYVDVLMKYAVLTEMNPAKYIPNRLALLRELELIFRYSEKYKIIESEYQEQLASLRRLSKSDPGIFLPFTAEILNDIALQYLGETRFRDAEKYAEEAVEINRQLWSADPEANGGRLGTSLRTEARIMLYSDLGDTKTCELVREADKLGATPGIFDSVARTRDEEEIIDQYCK